MGWGWLDTAFIVGIVVAVGAFADVLGMNDWSDYVLIAGVAIALGYSSGIVINRLDAGRWEWRPRKRL